MTNSALCGQVLVLDVGTSRLRVSAVRVDGSVETLIEDRLVVNVASAGTFEFDASLLAQSVLSATRAALSKVAGRVDGIGITTQRASTVVWDKKTGQPIGPAIGWQDLRTTGQCLALREKGFHLSPNQSATKAAFLIDHYGKKEQNKLAVGTVDSFCAFVLSDGELHVTDRSNAGVTGLLCSDASDWDDDVLDALGLDRGVLPKLVPSTGIFGSSSALEFGPALVGICGDQQASLIGQGCIKEGQTKATFGTGAMVDCCVAVRPVFEHRGPSGTFPVVAWQEGDIVTWGVEAIMLTAGTCVDWLCNGLQIIESPQASEAIGASVSDAGGVIFVPALSGLGTPTWDFGARGAFIGLSASSTRAEIVRAVLEGIAQRGAELIDAIEADCEVAVETLAIDGGMSTNSTFVELLADVTGRPIAVASVTEATTRGAGYLAGVAVGIWESLTDATTTASTKSIVEPTRRLDRERWRELSTRAEKTVPALSAISF